MCGEDVVLGGRRKHVPVRPAEEIPLESIHETLQPLRYAIVAHLADVGLFVVNVDNRARWTIGTFAVDAEEIARAVLETRDQAVIPVLRAEPIISEASLQGGLLQYFACGNESVLPVEVPVS